MNRSINFVRTLCVLAMAVCALAPAVFAQTPPTWNGGSPQCGSLSGCVGGSPIKPAAWPADAQWVPYSWGTTYPDSTLAQKHPIADQRVQDPSNGGTTPQNYVNVSSGCPDQSLPSIYYYYDPTADNGNGIIFFRWRVEQIANNYATGPSPGSYSSSNPWNSALWTVLLDLDGNGYRDFAMHLDGSSGSPAVPIDSLRSIWSSLTNTNSIDYVGDPTHIFSLYTNPTSFATGVNGQLYQFNGSGSPSTVQWPNGSSETYWDYGTTRSINISTSACGEYYVDYQIPVRMLNASGITVNGSAGPKMTTYTPFQFLFATANSLNNPFQKDIVWSGNFVCDASSPGPFGDALTLSGGIIPQPIVTSITAASATSCGVPLTAQIMDALTVNNCQSVSQIVNAQFMYYYDINGDGQDNDGGTWQAIGNPAAPTGTTITANWNTAGLIQGQYLIALQLTDGTRNHVTQTWMGKSSYSVTQPFATDTGGAGGATRGIYTNVPPLASIWDSVSGYPYVGLVASGVNKTLGINYQIVNVGGACAAPPPVATKVGSPSQLNQGGDITYTITINNTASTTGITVSQIVDQLPAGLSYKADAGGTLGSPTASPTLGATGTLTWTFNNLSVPGGASRTFQFTATANAGGTFYNTATISTNIGTLTAPDSTGVKVNTAALTISKTVGLQATPTTPVTLVNRTQNVTFTVTVTNNSQTTVTGAVITDPLPAGFTYVSSTSSPGALSGTYSNGTVTFNNGGSGYTIAVGGSYTFSITATANQAGPATNVATATSTNAATVSATTSLYVSGPVLAINKSANTTVVTPPSTISYSIQYANIGNQSGTLTTLTDVVPAGFTYTSFTPGLAPTPSSCSQAGTTVTCNFTNPNNTIGAGVTGTVTLNFNVTAAAPDPSTNTATINASDANSASTTFTVNVQSTTGCTSSNFNFLATRANVGSGTNGYAVGYVDMATGGTGYTSAATVTFSAPQLAGSTATGVSVGNATGSIGGVNVTSGGSGYTSAPTVSLTGGGGSGATATAILTNDQYIARVGTTGVDTSITRTVRELAEMARFYQDPTSTTTDYIVSSASFTTRWDNPSPGNSKVTYQLDLKDYDTVTNALTAIATTTGQSNNGGTFTDTLTVPANTYLKQGHRLVWIISARDPNNNANTTDTLHINDGTSFGTVCLQPIRMTLTKYANKLDVSRTGTDTIQYTIKYSNQSAITVNNVTIADPIPAGMTYASASVSTGTFTAPTVGTNGTINWTVGSVAAGGSGTMTVNLNVTSGIVGLTATNTATLSATNLTPITASTVTQIVAPNVLITKRVATQVAGVTKTSYLPGDPINYTMDIYNAGTAGATGVTMSDTLPAGLTFVSATTGQGSCSNTGNAVTCTIGSLSAGTTTSVTINATIAGAGLTAGQNPVTNTASVIDAYNTTPRTASATVTVTATPNLTLSEQVSAPQRVNFVNVTNGGSYTQPPTVTATGCTVAPILSVSTSPAADVTSTTYSVLGVNVISPGSGCTGPVTINFDTSNGSGATATAIVGPAPGDTITYTLTLGNTGTADAAGCIITGTIPSYTTWSSGGTATFTSTSTNVGTLAVGATAQFVYSVVVQSGLPYNYGTTWGDTSLSQTGSATSSNATPPPNVTSTLETGTSPRYTMAKTPKGDVLPWPLTTLVANASNSTSLTVVSSSLMNVGDYIAISNGSTWSIRQITGVNGTTVTINSGVNGANGTNILPVELYTLAYSNAGGTSGQFVTVTDQLPANMLFGGIISNGTATRTDSTAIGSSGTLTWQVGTLPNGTSNTIQYLAFTSTSGIYKNVAVISDGTSYADRSTYNDRNASDSATTTFGALNPTKVTTTPNVIAGNTAHYTITIQNPLSTTATSVVVTDNLPTGFTYNTGTTVVKLNGSTVSTVDPGGSTAVPVWSGTSLNISGNGTLTIDFTVTVSSNVVTGSYDNSIGVTSSTPSLTFDYLGTTAENVYVCDSAAPIIPSSPAAVCASSTGNIVSTTLRPQAAYNWAITNGTITSTGITTVNSITIANGGTGYASAPTVTIAPPTSGTQATATATVASGAVTAITITNPGSGYTSAPTVTIGGPGTGASATAVLGTGIIYTAGATSGANATTISVTVTEGVCSVSTSRSVTVNAAPVVTAQPSDKSICNNTAITFSVSATGVSTYQWQVSTNGGSSWSNVVTGTGGTTATYSYTPNTVTDNGKEFRCVLTGASGCVTISDPATITVSGTCIPDLEVTYDNDSPDPVTAGSNITYSQLFTNIGSAAAGTPITVTETVPTGTTFVAIIPPSGFTCTPPAVGGTGSFTCTRASTLATGVSTGVFTFIVKVDPSTTDGTTITDTVSISTSSTEVTLTNNSGSTATTVARSIDAQTTKNDNASTAGYGAHYLYPGNPPSPQNLTWSITAADTGLSRTSNLTINDTMPFGFTYGSYTVTPAAGNTCSYSSSSTALTCTITSLDPTPFVSFFGGTGGTAATASISGGSITSIAITNAGTGYVTTPTVTIGAPPAGGTTATATATISGGNVVNITITNAGSGYTATPAVTISAPGGANVTATATASMSTAVSRVSSIAVTSGGSGYTSAPQVFITGGGGTGATATATISSGAVTAITVTNGGSGYTSAPTVSFSGGSGSPAAVATVGASGCNAGTSGVISLLTLRSGGTGYTTAPTVVISTYGTGSGATATATLSNGAVTTLSLGSGGTGYTNTPVVCVAGTTSVDTTAITNNVTISYPETDTYTSNDPSSDSVIVLSPTVVKMLKMDASQSKNAATITWSTTYEQDNLGFYVYRSGADGVKQKISTNIIPGSALFTARTATSGRTYRFMDKNAPTGFVQYWLEDVDLKGVHTMHGPITPKLVTSTSTTNPPTDPDPGLGSVGGVFTTAPGMGVNPAVAAPSLTDTSRLNQQWNVAATANAKIIVTQPGWYSVKKSDLVAAGFDPGTNPSKISVFVDGAEVAVVVNTAKSNFFDTNDTIEFYGTAIDTPSSGSHVYYVSTAKGNGLRVKDASVSKGGAAPATFNYTFNRTERRTFFAALTSNGDRDNFFGAFITTDPISETLSASNIGGGNASMHVVLQGVNLKYNHAVSVQINGHEIGPIRFADQTRNISDLSFPSSYLVEGDNLLTLTSTGGSDDVNLIETVGLTYPHTYKAEQNVLSFTAPAATSVTVTGYTSANVRVFDITDPTSPQNVASTLTAAADGTKTVTFSTATGNGTRTLLAVGDARVLPAAQIVYNEPSKWNATSNAANLVIVTNRAFIDAANTLAAARNSQGIKTAVVDVQNLYDEFAYGTRGPDAIRQFFQRATTSWATAPKYAILLGDSSFDARNYYGMGAYDFVPTKMRPTSYLKAASDDWFSDFTNNSSPVIATGRIPVRTADEAAGVVAKLTKRTTTPPSGTWATNVEVIADYINEDGIPFDQGADQIAAAIPAPYSADRISFGKVSSPSAAVTDAFNRGSILTDYTGHGSVEIWSDYVFGSWDAAALTNGDKTPFVVTLNCLNGLFNDLFTESIAEALLKNPNGGSIGGVSSSALTSPDQQFLVNQAFNKLVFGGSTVGDALLQAKKATNDTDVRNSFLLFGDPTLKLK